MDLTNLINLINSPQIIEIFIKVSAIIFSFLYLFYALVIYKQTQILNDTLTVEKNSLITFISFIQVFIGIGLVLFAIFLI